MWYVFEGGDLTGKTSLVTKFQELTGFQVFRPTRPKKLLDAVAWDLCVESEMKQMEQFAVSGLVNMIMDRTVYISDPVYAPVFGRETREDLLTRAEMWGIPHTIIYCYAELQEKIRRENKRKEEKYPIRKHDHEIEAGYNEILKKLYHWQVIRINTTHSSMDVCMKGLMLMLDYLGVLKCEPTHSENLWQWMIEQNSFTPVSAL